MKLRDIAPPELVGRKYDFQVLAVRTAGQDPVVTLPAGAEAGGELRVDTTGDALLVAAAVEVYDGANGVVTRSNLGLLTMTLEDNSGAGKQIIPLPVPLSLVAAVGPQEDVRELRVPIVVKAGGVLSFKFKNSSASERRVRMAFDALRFTATGALTL